jgi:hypothetical protein
MLKKLTRHADSPPSEQSISGLDASQTASPSQGSGERFFLLTSPLIGFVRNCAVPDVVDELVALAWHTRLNAELAVPVISHTASLADVLAFRFSPFADRLKEQNVKEANVDCEPRWSP